MLGTIPVEDYDLEAARVHAALLADARRAGRPRGPHDLLIAATAIARRRTLVTFDRSEFEGIDGLDIRPDAGLISIPVSKRASRTAEPN